MYSKLIIVISPDEREALEQIANKEMRGVPDQARYILRKELIRRGILKGERLIENTPMKISEKAQIDQ